MVQVETRASGIWRMTSAVVASAGSCLVVDAGYFPREMEELRLAVEGLGRVEAIVFTHGHWDHVLGHTVFPGAPVLVSAALVEAVRTGREGPGKCMEEAREFDSRWYVERGAGAPYAWPGTLRGLSDGERVRLGEARLRALHLPGHSADGLGLLAEDEGILIAGDHLSPVEIPFVEDLDAYLATLRRLLELIETGGAERVVPGHGGPLDRARARSIAVADLAYLEGIASARDALDPAAALAVELPRAADVVGMREHHLENCRAAGLRVS